MLPSMIGIFTYLLGLMKLNVFTEPQMSFVSVNIQFNNNEIRSRVMLNLRRGFREEGGVSMVTET